MSDNVKPVVCLASDVTLAAMDVEDRRKAIDAAYWITCSPHEWSWTQEQQELMARYVLWATQRLAGVNQLASGDLGRSEGEKR